MRRINIIYHVCWQLIIADKQEQGFIATKQARCDHNTPTDHIVTI